MAAPEAPKLSELVDSLKAIEKKTKEICGLFQKDYNDCVSILTGEVASEGLDLNGIFGQFYIHNHTIDDLLIHVAPVITAISKKPLE